MPLFGLKLTGFRKVQKRLTGITRRARWVRSITTPFGGFPPFKHYYTSKMLLDYIVSGGQRPGLYNARIVIRYRRHSFWAVVYVGRTYGDGQILRRYYFKSRTIDAALRRQMQIGRQFTQGRRVVINRGLHLDPVARRVAANKQSLGGYGR